MKDPSLGEFCGGLVVRIRCFHCCGTWFVSPPPPEKKRKNIQTFMCLLQGVPFLGLASHSPKMAATALNNMSSHTTFKVGKEGIEDIYCIEKANLFHKLHGSFSSPSAQN